MTIPTKRLSAYTIGLLALICLLPGTSVPPTTPDGASSEAMEALASYIGSWRALEERTTPDGAPYRFGYRLEYFDTQQTIIKMTITQEFEGGEATLLWEGFKGWNPVQEVTYYHGFSPSGRAAHGFVKKVSETELHTEYEGYGPNGQGVLIRDVFTRTDENHFTSVTSMHRDGAWTPIMEDNWERVKSP